MILILNLVLIVYLLMSRTPASAARRMPRHGFPIALILLIVGTAALAEDYPSGPDSMCRPGVPRGTVIANPPDGAVSGNAFGGPGFQTLYMTSGDHVYRRHVRRKGVSPGGC